MTQSKFKQIQKSFTDFNETDLNCVKPIKYMYRKIYSLRLILRTHYFSVLRIYLFHSLFNDAVLVTWII
jgi:hypothetical protein